MQGATRLQSHLHRHDDGLVNVSYIVGVISSINGVNFHLRQNNAPDFALPMRMPEGDTLPGIFRVGSLVKVYARLTPKLVIDESGPRWETECNVFGMEQPNILEAPTAGGWMLKGELTKRMKLEQTVPEAVGSDEEHIQEGLKTIERKAANRVDLCGFVVAKNYAEAVSDSEKRRRERLTVAMQVSGMVEVDIGEGSRKMVSPRIFVRLYGKQASAYQKALRTGMLIMIRNGTLKIDRKETIGPDLSVIVTKTLFVETTQLQNPTPADVSFIPSWAQKQFSIDAAGRSVPRAADDDAQGGNESGARSERAEAQA